MINTEEFKKTILYDKNKINDDILSMVRSDKNTTLLECISDYSEKHNIDIEKEMPHLLGQQLKSMLEIEAESLHLIHSSKRLPLE